MKSKLLLSAFFMICSITLNYAQSSATQSGIAVQGIARDNNNTARTNQTISLTYTLYYLDAAKAPKEIYTTTKNVTTDNFGVFSDVIEPAATNNFLFADNIAYIKIENGDDVISDEQLRHVPYAISANNGVPTGSIMPFIGAVAPIGWALCNGTPLPTTATALISMVGANAPNLQGMFLRGTGTAGAGQTGPALKAVQQDSFEKHAHGPGTLTTNTTGNHNHSDGEYQYILRVTGDNTSGNIDDTSGEPDVKYPKKMKDAGSHSHAVTAGVTQEIGIDETRPVNYGVNYIIKL